LTTETPAGRKTANAGLKSSLWRSQNRSQKLLEGQVWRSQRAEKSKK
jgi:hypothetical protein